MISAGTVAEALSVATRRNVDNEMSRLSTLGVEVVGLTSASARRIAQPMRYRARACILMV